MIIYRSFYREAAQTISAIVTVLVIVFVLVGMTAILGRAARGQFSEQIVFQLLGWETLRRLDLLLPLGAYLGILLTFSRWYRDSEMAVLAACGVGLSRLLYPVLGLAFVTAGLVAVASFLVTPAASRAIDELKAESSQRQYTGIAAGNFTRSGVGGRIIYAETVSDTGGLGQVFVSHPATGRSRVILARAGHPYLDRSTGDRFIVLVDGWAYDGTPGKPDYRIVHFDQYAVRIDSKPFVPLPTTNEAMKTRDLFVAQGRHAAAEWQWRLSKPLFVIVLAVFAAALSYTDARRGRLANLFVAILVYFIYSNLLGVGQTLIKEARVSEGLGLWWVHAVMAVVAVYLFYRRNYHLPLVPKIRVPWFERASA